MSSREAEWEKVGAIGVDAGLCWLGDPCYVKDGVPWDRITSQGGDAREHAEGVCVSTGVGDGYYNVYVKRVDLAGWGRRIAAVKVVFLPGEGGEPDEEDDDERG